VLTNPASRKDEFAQRHANIRNDAQIFVQVHNRNCEAVRLLVAQQGASSSRSKLPFNINARDVDGRTVLHWATAQGAVELVAALTKIVGIDFAARDSQVCIDKLHGF